jgi:hypothetical protein
MIKLQASNANQNKPEIRSMPSSLLDIYLYVYAYEYKYLSEAKGSGPSTRY